ncbi:AAA family ATPase [Hymenobacter sublimis]|uniref:ATP-binding protein n=1 Tax=Hymenobacter sublimis TaxID=2933777 RepID=A0ABY4JE34_9BACT|nr:ATP-binding protein [Hymenobacter sublimis]UPL50223.1 ATP-binding protein [Hymenobacter sublimis]
MLKRLHVRNFTVFADAEFNFSSGLNVIVGTNGTGKSHVLKLGYAVEAASALMSTIREKGMEGSVGNFTWDFTLTHYLADVFRTDNKLKSLVRRESTQADSSVKLEMSAGVHDIIEFKFPFQAASEYVDVELIHVTPPESITLAPVFLPAKEVLSLFPGLGSLYKRYELPIDRAFADLVDQLNVPLLRNPEAGVAAVINALERVMKGRIKVENGRFYLYPDKGERFEIDLVAEGVRKLAALAYLLGNGSLSAGVTLYWDEPEANLNAALIREVARLLTLLADQGFQIIIATHSLFLLKELHILSHRAQAKPVRYFGLFVGPKGETQVEATDDFELLQHITALDAELTQTFDYEETLDQANDDADNTRG